jgi:hypothetical protein
MIRRLPGTCSILWGAKAVARQLGLSSQKVLASASISVARPR